VIIPILLMTLLVDAKVDRPKRERKGVERSTKKTTEPDAAPAPVAVPAAADSQSLPEPSAAQKQEAAAPRVKPPLRIAVYELELQDVPGPVGIVVSESLLGEVRKLQGISAIGMSEIRDMLTHEATKQLAGCSESGESCMAEMAGALGVDELLTGKLAKVGDNSVITLRRIDHKRAAVTKVFDQRLKLGSGQEYLAAVGPSVEQLFTEYQLKQGAVRGVAKEVALRLDPPPIPRTATVVVASVSVATAIAATVFSVLTVTSQSSYNEYARSGTNGGTIDGATLVQKGRELEQRALISNVALVAGVMAFFTDWKGYREANAKLSARLEN
jgi:hypothetical protein